MRRGSYWGEYWRGLGGMGGRERSIHCGPTPRQLPRALRIGVDNYFRLLPADLWTRLEDAAADVVSGNKGVPARVWAMALYLYKQRAENGTVQINRDELALCTPALRTYKEAGQRERLDRYTVQAYEIMQRAGLLLDVQLVGPNRMTDALRLNPGDVSAREAGTGSREGGVICRQQM